MSERFDNRQAQVAGGLCFGLFLLIGLSGLAEGPASRIEGLGWTLFGGYMTRRALTSSKVTLDASAVTVRSINRTRRFALSEVSRAEVAVGVTGLASGSREYLALYLEDGRRIAFTELNAPIRAPGVTSVVRHAVSRINERLLPE